MENTERFILIVGWESCTKKIEGSIVEIPSLKILRQDSYQDVVRMVGQAPQYFSLVILHSSLRMRSMANDLLSAQRGIIDRGYRGPFLLIATEEEPKRFQDADLPSDTLVINTSRACHPSSYAQMVRDTVARILGISLPRSEVAASA